MRRTLAVPLADKGLACNFEQTAPWPASYALIKADVSRLAKHSERIGGKMKPSTKDQIKGKLHEMKGKVKEKAGQATNNPNLAAEGQDEKLAGKVQKKVGQVEKVFGE
jgi:uncharacterized protein YjbJ (UPF0337 family)